MSEFLDYYKVISELKGREKFSRSENYVLLKKALGMWNNRAGTEAISIQNLIKKAMKVFNDENEYKKFRMYVLNDRYEPFVQGILSDGIVTEDEKRDLEEKAKQTGFSQQEIDAFLALKNITVSQPGPSKTRSTTTGATKTGKKHKPEKLTSFSTLGVSFVCGIYTLYLINALVLTTWEIIGVIGGVVVSGFSVAAVNRKHMSGYFWFLVGAFIIWAINLKIFFALIPIILTYSISRALFRLYPDKSLLIGVIPASAFIVAWLGYGLVSGELTLLKSVHTGVVTAPQGANIRSGPSTNYSIVMALPKGHKLKVLGKIKNTNWYKVEFTHAGKTRRGYIYSSLVHITKSITNLPIKPPTKSMYSWGSSISDSSTREWPQKTSDKEARETSSRIALVTIKVNSNPKDASLYVNGHYKGQTPISISVPVGEVTLYLKKPPNYKEIKKRTVVKESSPKEWNLKLQLIVPSLVGTWKGQFGDWPFTIVIQTQEGTNLNGYDEFPLSRDSKYKYSIKKILKGTVRPSTKSIILEEQGFGKFIGKLSLDGKSMKGKWKPYKDGFVPSDWSVRFYSSSVESASSND